MKTEFYELDKLNNVSELIQKRYNLFCIIDIKLIFIMNILYFIA